MDYFPPTTTWSTLCTKVVNLAVSSHITWIPSYVWYFDCFPDEWGSYLQGNQAIHIQRWSPICFHGPGILLIVNFLLILNLYWVSFIWTFKLHLLKEAKWSNFFSISSIFLPISDYIWRNSCEWISNWGGKNKMAERGNGLQFAPVEW